MSTSPSLSYSTIFLVVFGRQLCLPFPSDLLLVLGGAMWATGHISLFPLLLVSILACILGDSVWYVAGRYRGNQVLTALASLADNPTALALKARRLLQRWGLRLLLVAKFIPGLDAITAALAGSEKVELRRFWFADASGSVLWVAACLSVGVVFHDQVVPLLHIMRAVGIFLAIVVAAPLFLVAGWRAGRLIHMVRYLRVRTISAKLLHDKLEHPENVTLIDLQRFEGEDRAPEGIPGAVAIAPERLSLRSKLKIPAHIDIVLYSSSMPELTTAGVALALRRRGVQNVYVLAGGLSSWQVEGFPVSQQLRTINEEKIRLGIEVQA